ncbi:MAG TPA: DUF4152 family protein [archaeon]|nr:DUF4152 family protein [archaeon]
MNICAADSGSAILNDYFEPLVTVATVAVFVKPPYREPNQCLSRPSFIPVNGQRLVVDELALCKEMLKDVKADVVHLDMTLGGISLEELTPAQLNSMPLSSRARVNILQVLPELRKIAADIKRIHGINVVAIGKESIPVRIAELTVGAYSILYATEKVVNEGKKIMVGLPTACTFHVYNEGLTMRSLLPTEHDIVTHVKDESRMLDKVQVTEIANPKARNFRVAIIQPS